MSRTGIAFSGGMNASDIVSCVRLAEQLGYDSAWFAEGHGGDQFALMAACATATSTIRLGTAISSVFVRSAPTIAMAAATVDQLSKGRMILGLGSSHKVQVEPEHGIAYGQPLARVRDTVAAIRALLRDGAVQYQGETVRIENFDLWFEPYRADMPIYLSALFPKMTALTGEVADGVILVNSTLDTAAEIRANLEVGARQAGRDAAALEITSLLPVSVSEDRTAALEAMRPGTAFYVGFFPRYERLMARQGFAQEAATVARLFRSGDREAAAAAVTDGMIAATSLTGTPDECRTRLNEYRASGIDVPIVTAFARGPDSRAIYERVIRLCAPG